MNGGIFNGRPVGNKGSYIVCSHADLSIAKYIIDRISTKLNRVCKKLITNIFLKYILNILINFPNVIKG